MDIIEDKNQTNDILFTNKERETIYNGGIDTSLDAFDSVAREVADV